MPNRMFVCWLLGFVRAWNDSFPRLHSRSDKQSLQNSLSAPQTTPTGCSKKLSLSSALEVELRSQWNVGRLAPPATRARLPAIPQCQLNLPWIEHSAWRGVIRVRRALGKERSRAAGSGHRRHIAKIRRAVHGVEVSDVDVVREVEGFGDQLQRLALAEMERARTAQVDDINALASERIAAFDPHSVVIAENVAVGIEARKLGEKLGRLQRDDGAELIIPQPHASRRGRRHRAVSHKALTEVVGGIVLLSPEIPAVLGDEHEARVRPVVN